MTTFVGQLATHNKFEIVCGAKEESIYIEKKQFIRYSGLFLSGQLNTFLQSGLLQKKVMVQVPAVMAFCV